MTNRELFPLKLKTYMDLARINQTDLADAVNVSKSTVHCWLTGKAFPRIDVIQKIADTLGCKTDDLLVKNKMSIISEIRVPFNINSPAFRALQERAEGGQNTQAQADLDEDDEELIRLWNAATPTAKKAALAVLKAMEGKE